MKSEVTRKKFPATPAEWEALIAAAPGKDRALTAAEEKKMANAVVVAPQSGLAWPSDLTVTGTAELPTT